MILLTGGISILTFIIGYYVGLYTGPVELKSDEWVVLPTKGREHLTYLPDQGLGEKVPLLNPSAPPEDTNITLNPVYTFQN